MSQNASMPVTSPSMAQPVVGPSYDTLAHRLVADLHAAKPAVYWTDLAMTAGLGWGAFAYAVLAQPFSIAQLAALGIACFALYRGLCFLHEITHLRPGAVRGFETAWNLLIGAPLLMPSFVYVGVHQNHHNLATYGTDQDPEYLPFSSSHLMPVLFVAHSILIPAALLVRFLLLAPAALLSSRLRVFLITHASSLSMNKRYRRRFTPELAARIRRWELAALALWLTMAWVGWSSGLGWRMLAAWYAVTGLTGVINSIRTLAAHRYEGSGAPRDRVGQLTDSVDVPGAPWTELWAPVGLRYHALHHYFPGIPYHNLPAANRRLMDGLPEASPYRRVVSPGLFHSLRSLYRRGRTASAGRAT